jgi:hypothetical protein
MDSSREDQTRISVGTVQDWQRLKFNFSHTALTHVEGIVSSDLTSEKDALIAHMNQVHKLTAYALAF